MALSVSVSIVIEMRWMQKAGYNFIPNSQSTWNQKVALARVS